MPQLSVQDRTTCNSCLHCYEVVLAEIHLKELSISLLHGVGGRVQVSGYASVWNQAWRCTICSMNFTVFTDHRADGILDVQPILAIALDSRLHILEDSSQSISSVICEDRYVLAIDGAPPPVLQVATLPYCVMSVT